MVELSEIKRLLLSATLKHRREAVKLLDVQLASPLFLRQLDINTVKLWPEDKIQLVSWPGLVDTYLNYVHKEVTEHKKQLDATALKVFKTIFTAADNAERCGPGRNNLLRRAGAAFDKFGKVLEVSPLGQGLATPLGKEIASVLLKVLLPNQAYCQRATVEAFQGLVEEVMLRFEALQQQVEESSAASAHKAAAATAAGRLAAGGRDGGSTGTAAVQQELFSMANLLAGLLTGVPGQMAGMFVVDLLAFLTQALSWLDKQGEYGRVSRQLMACLNGLLLTYGADLRPQLPTTHKALSTYIRHAWTAHTNVPIKDGVLCYCRLSVALGGAQAVGTSLNDLLDLVSREINAPSFTWDLAGSKQHQQLAPLAATLYYHAAFASAATVAGRSAAAASGAAAPAAAAEVGSCGSNGDAPTAAGASTGKRRSSTAGISGATPAATAGGNGEVAGGDVDSEDELLQLPRKRSRVMGPAGQLLMFLQTDPERWGPVTALLLHQHGPLLPPAFLAALQQQLTASVGRCLAALGQALTAASGSSAPLNAAAVGAALDRRSTSPAGISTGAAAAAARAAQCHPQLLWLMRCLCELALCWPAALHPLSAAVHTNAAGVAGSHSDPAAAAAADGSLGPAYDASEGCCRRQAWLHADALAAQRCCSSGWHQLWDGCTSMLAGEPAEVGSVRSDLCEAMTWLLHVLAALRLVQLPSRAATLMKLQRLWLPKQQQQQQQGQAAAGDAHDDEPQHSQQQEQQIVLSSAQLALLLSLCLGQQVTSHRDMLLRQQLLQACFSTAESATSSNRRSSRFSSGHRGVGLGSAAAAAGAHAGARCLPDLLLPAILALLGAPGLPTPSLNGAPAAVTAASAAQAVLGSVQHSWCFATGPGATAAGAAGTRNAHGLSPTTADSLLGVCSSSTASTVWYSAGDTWWWAEQHLEVQLAGLDTGLDSIKRQLAAERLQHMLAAAAAGTDAGPGTTTSETPAAEPGAQSAWWKCWCRLADETAEYLSNALLPFTPGGQDDDHGWGPSQETVAAGGGPDGAGPAAAAAAPADPVMQLCHLLLLLNASVSLPCIAALQHQRHQQQQQQAALERQRKVEAGCLQQGQEQPGDQQQEEQRLREGMFCGFGFSRHPEQHQQLQQLVMEAGIRAGELLADNLQHLPCHPSSTWLQQLLHLGNNLARIQALMTALPTPHGPDSSKVKYQMLAAASLLAEVVKVLERVTKQSADAASAELEGQQGGAGAGDELDLVDDFMDTGLPPARPGQYGSTQQQGFAMPAASMMSTPAPSYRPSQMGPYTAARPGHSTAAASAGAASSSGPAVFVGGGLAGFSGRAALGLGNPSASMTPAMLPAHGSMFTRAAAAGVGCGEPGFAVGALGEGLSGVCGAEGAGLRVFAAVAPAYADTAQALMRLWVHMAGLTGWAPPESLLQAVVEVATTAVCTGGWSHLQQLFGLMKGSHTLLAAQKVPSSTSHIILRLLQQVAIAAAAAGLRLDVPCAVPESQGSQEQSQLSSQDNKGARQGSTYMSVMLEICADVQKRLGLKQGSPQGESHLAMSTQLQLGLTTLALLQLQPQAGYSTQPIRGHAHVTTAPHADMLAAWRQQCLLALLSSPSFALRARAGPLAAALLTVVAASSAAAWPRAGHANGSSSGASVTECVSAALADISGYLFLQDSSQLTAAQAARAHRRQDALQQLNAPGAVGGNAKAELDATSREAHQDAVAWEVAVVQLVDLAQATLATTCAALQQQQQANALDAQLLMLLLRHTASLQLLPKDSISSQGSGNTASGSSCSSSSVRLRALRTAAAALDVMAARQQYPDRFSYLRYHCSAWAKEWVSADCTVQSLLAVQVLMCPPAAGAQSDVLLVGSSLALEAVTAATQAGHAPGPSASAPDRSLLQCFGSSLVFWMIFYDKQAELSALAAAAGLEEEALLQGFKHELCSSLYPLLRVPELRPQVARFRQKVPKNAEALTQEANVTLVFSMLEHALPVLPPVSLEEHEQAQDGQPQLDLEATLPFLTQAAAAVGFAVVAKVQKEVSWLAALPFNPAGIQALLLRVHRSVASAECLMHKVQRMGQFQCLLRQLPTAHLQSPAVARSLVSMLLQQLHVTQLQGICCSCLQLLFSELFLAVQPLQGGQAGDSLSEAKKAGLTAKQQQQQQQQRRHEELVTALLEELLPPTVAALVQCVERAVTGVQLQQQAELWALHPNAAAATAAAAGSSSAGLDPLSGLAPVVLLHSLLQSDFLSKSSILMDPLPPLPALSVTQQQRRWYEGDLRCLVPWFADRAASMTASSRQRAVHELRAKLQGGRAAGVLLAKQQDNSRTQQQISTEGERAEAAVDPKVAAAAFKLVRIGAELCDEHVMQLAAELLAVVGPMDPDVITLDHAAAAAAGEGPDSTGRSNSSSSSHADKTAFPLRAVLQLLAEGLFDGRPDVVSSAQQTLAALVSVLDTSVLQQALQPPGSDASVPGHSTGLLLQSYVATYILSRSGFVSLECSTDATAAASVAAASKDLWSPAGKSYQQWLCTLSSTLLQACGAVTDAAVATRRSGRTATAAAGSGALASAALLQLLADAAAINPQLAELLLPHAVLKLCESDGSGADVSGAGSLGWAARLAAAAAAGLRLEELVDSTAGAMGRPDVSPWEASRTGDSASGTGDTVDATDGVDARCYSVLLACLEHNRSVHRLALMSMPCDPVPAPVAWHRTFCLHLDYLAVAAAAMAVKAYFTALLYIEQWCADARQTDQNPFDGGVADSNLLQLQQLAGLTSSNSTSATSASTEFAQQGARQQQLLLEQLLLELYGNVNEPDGVYAVAAAFGSPTSQLQVLQHEQQWAAVLGGQDALLQAAVLQGSQQRQGNTLHVAGALTALQRLGCPATAERCVSGALLQQQQQQRVHTSISLPASFQPAQQLQQRQQQQAQRLHETQRELAWRLSDWGLVDSLNPGGAGQPGFATGLASGPLAMAAAGAASSVTQPGPQDGHQEEGFHAAVLAALTAMERRDEDAFSASVSAARQGCVLQLARSSTQSAAAVNPLLVQLQMLQMLSQGLTAAKSAAAASAGTADADWSAGATRSLLTQLLGTQLPAGASPAAIKLCGVSFELSDQLLSLQGALTRALRRPDALLATLQASMRVARKAGQVNFAAAAVAQLQETLHQAVLGSRLSAHGQPGLIGLGLQPVSGGAGSSGAHKLPSWLQRAIAADAGWPLEAAKLRWLQGQHQVALKELQSLATSLQTQLTDLQNKQQEQQKQAKAGSASSSILDQDVRSVTYALTEAKMLLGKWMAAGEGSFSSIQGAVQHLQSAAELTGGYLKQVGLSAGDMMRLHSRVCYQLAACADQHYQMLDAQVASPEFQKQQQVLRTKEQLLQQLSGAVEASRNWQRLPPAKQQSAKAAYMPVARRFAETQRQVQLDRQAVAQLQQSRTNYLTAALAAYRECIKAGDKHDLQVVYRMCGLWFRHSDDTTINSILNETFKDVPTAKFIPLVYQIASRLDNTPGVFQVALTNALYWMATDHPYHALYPIIALSNGDTDGGDPAGKNVHIRHETNTGRVAAATALLQRLRAIPQLQPIVDDMTAQVQDLIGMTLQVHKALPRDQRGTLAVDQYTMPANFRRKLKSLQHAPPICYSLPLDPQRRYDAVPHVVEIDTTIKIAGGINSPLIVRTTDNYGRVQRQLCKCNDDLRQDAVMQQFFGLVDTLLAGSPDSRQRRLGIRTYRVVPCSPLVGVLEWVEGTLPLTEYLLGDRSSNYSGGASGRYHRQEGLSWLECYMRMDKAQPTDLNATYLYCCKHFPPVFRHFFLEAFPYPSDWFEARTRYTRSTAVASMAGAIIGLGDRHLGNILLDTHTAEVVHIDLGIAFEQGLFLQTPERVPFRLTPNIVDGMGAAGVEGPFRRCCETALQALRRHQDALLTVVQVVLHDPLYRWQMTPIKAGRKQQDPIPAEQGAGDAAAGTSTGAAAAAAAGDTSGAAGGPSSAVGASSGSIGNADAERAVLRVKQKLQGQDVEGGASLSEAAQVAAMLQTARDPDNLSRMFKGWAPWV